MRLYRELQADDALSPLAVEGLTLELLAQVGRTQTRTDKRPPEWLVRLLERLEAELAQPLTLAELAADSGLHPVHVSRVFRRTMGKTIGEHLQALRVAFVCGELLRAETPLAELAIAAGFADQSHLTRVFKRALGVAPGAFRKGTRIAGPRPCEVVDALAV